MVRKVVSLLRLPLFVPIPTCELGTKSDYHFIGNRGVAASSIDVYMLNLSKLLLLRQNQQRGSFVGCCGIKTAPAMTIESQLTETVGNN